MGKHLRLLGALTICATLALSGCGGGGGSTPADSNLTSINSGVAVDPYIVGAIFEEIDANGNVRQTSDASNENGVFVFPGNLQVGSKIRIKAGNEGLHAGTLFQGTLMRNVDISSGKLVLNPLTTLIAQGKSETEVLQLVKDITGNTTFTAADLTTDPMANLSDGTMTDADKSLLAANMAVNSAVVVLKGNTGNLTNLTAVAVVVADKLVTQVFYTLTPTSNVAALNIASATGVTVTNYLTKTVVVEDDGTTNVQIVTETVTANYIDDIAAAVALDPTKTFVIEDPTVAPVPSEPVNPADPNAMAQAYYTAGQLAYTEGSTSGSTAKLMTAIEKFNAAEALTGSITDVALKDKVLFFGAFAKVLQVAKPMSDGTANGLNNFGDILDAFGLEGAPAATDRSNLNTLSIDTCTTVTDTYGSWQECDLALDAASPTSGELQTFMYAKVGAGLTDAVAMLGQVSSTFNTSVNDGGTTVEFDATDAKFISALANGMLAQINLVQAYDLNVDIDAETNRTTEQTPEDFLTAHKTLGTLKDATRVAAVKTYANAAITALEEAVVALELENDEQVDDFLKFDNTNCYWTDTYICDPTIYNDTAEIAEFKTTLAEAKIAINASTYDVIDGAGEVAAVIDVSKFFAGVDLRSKIPTSFNNGASGDMPGLLPDPTFGGVLMEIDGQAPANLNIDEDGDGSPDFLQDYLVYPIQTANIAIDGQISDWNGISPIADDADNDSTGNLATEIDKIFIAKSAANIYVRVDLIGNYIFPHTPSMDYSHYEVGVHAFQGGCSQGLGFLIANDFTSSTSERVQQLDRYFDNYFSGPLTQAYSGKSREILIPISSLPAGTTHIGLNPYIQAFHYNTPFSNPHYDEVEMWDYCMSIN
jgi:hypothetical protein